jgi:putative transposase
MGIFLFRAVHKLGDIFDFMLSERRNEKSATAFFKQAIDTKGFPKKVVMDKSGPNLRFINPLINEITPNCQHQPAGY